MFVDRYSCYLTNRTPKSPDFFITGITIRGSYLVAFCNDRLPDMLDLVESPAPWEGFKWWIPESWLTTWLIWCLVRVEWAEGGCEDKGAWGCAACCPLLENCWLPADLMTFVEQNKTLCISQYNIVCPEIIGTWKTYCKKGLPGVAAADIPQESDEYS